MDVFSEINKVNTRILLESAFRNKIKHLVSLIRKTGDDDYQLRDQFIELAAFAINGIALLSRFHPIKAFPKATEDVKEERNAQWGGAKHDADRWCDLIEKHVNRTDVPSDRAFTIVAALAVAAAETMQRKLFV